MQVDFTSLQNVTHAELIISESTWQSLLAIRKTVLKREPFLLFAVLNAIASSVMNSPAEEELSAMIALPISAWLRWNDLGEKTPGTTVNGSIPSKHLEGFAHTVVARFLVFIVITLFQSLVVAFQTSGILFLLVRHVTFVNTRKIQKHFFLQTSTITFHRSSVNLGKVDRIYRIHIIVCFKSGHGLFSLGRIRNGLQSRQAPIAIEVEGLDTDCDLASSAGRTESHAKDTGTGIMRLSRRIPVERTQGSGHNIGCGSELVWSRSITNIYRWGSTGEGFVDTSTNSADIRVGIDGDIDGGSSTGIGMVNMNHLDVGYGTTFGKISVP